jgi:hypothetical protein
LVLHALRLKGFADDAVVAAHTGLPVITASSLLAELRADGLVAHRDGRVVGWALTPAGRVENATAVTAEADGAGSEIRAAYTDFLAVNQDLLTACTDWQLRRGGERVAGEPVLNDHTDPAYDAEVVARLAAIDDHIQPVCAALAATLDRFASYGPRLAHARARVAAGDGDWFTRPLIDSYHTVWFELHEDLLSTLGIERSKEEMLS